MSYPPGFRGPRLRRGIRFAATTLLLAAIAVLGVPTAYADAPVGWPVGAWPTCTSPSEQYCVESATVTPLDGSPTPVAALGLTASVATLPGVVTSVNWSIDGWSGGSVTDDVRDGTAELVVRVGAFPPRYTMAIAQDLRVTRANTGGGNMTLTITGRAVHIDWTTGSLFATCVAGTNCGTADTMADNVGSGPRFMGNTQDLETWGPEYVSSLDGMYIATDAQARPTTLVLGTEPEPYWQMAVLGNPHLDAAGNPVRGSFNAWLPPAYFASLSTTAAAAAAIGFDVVSQQGYSSVSVPATVTVADGGVAFDVPDLGYSIRDIQVMNRPSTAVVGTVPGRPSGVILGPTADGLTVDWTAPTDTGGSALMSYTARAFTAASGGSVVASCTATVPTRSCVMAGLTPGTTYHVAVSASNALGEGLATSPRTAGSPSLLPTAPRSVVLTPDAGVIAAAWDEPASGGGTAITGYTMRAYAAASGGSPVATCTSNAVDLGCTVSGLTDGTTYHLSVTATNSNGTGPASAPRVSAIAGVPPIAPEPPTDVVAVPGDGILTVSWTAAASFGNGTFTSYTATTTPGNMVCTAGAEATCPITGLTNGTAYTVSVVTTATSGVSLASTASPAATPGAPVLPETAPTGDAALTSSIGGTFSSTSRDSTLSGSGFAPNTPVLVGIYAPLTTLAAATTDGTGGVVVDITLPDDASGNHTLVITGTAAGGAVRTLTLAITVTDDATAADDDTLPVTGDNIAGMATTGAALLVAGLIPVVALRRRPVAVWVPKHSLGAWVPRHRR